MLYFIGLPAWRESAVRGLVGIFVAEVMIMVQELTTKRKYMNDALHSLHFRIIELAMSS